LSKKNAYFDLFCKLVLRFSTDVKDEKENCFKIYNILRKQWGRSEFGPGGKHLTIPKS
jgi:hypothetical protein